MEGLERGCRGRKNEKLYNLFNEKFFRQIKGTAMCTKFAPMYAILL
jgi:hypothetical protein